MARGRSPRCAEADPAPDGLGREAFIDAAVTVLVLPITIVVVAPHGRVATVIAQLSIETSSYTGALTGPHAADDGRLSKALVAGPIAVLVLAIAFVIEAGGVARCTLGHDSARHAGRGAGGCANAGPTRDGARVESLVGAPITVGVEPIAGGVAAPDVARGTLVHKVAVHTAPKAGRPTHAHAARNRGHRHGFVSLAVAVVVPAITDCVIARRVTGLTVFDDGAAHARRDADGRADPQAAGGRPGDEALVHPSIAVGVLAIAGGVAPPDFTGRTIVDGATVDASALSLRRAHADATIGHLDPKRFVDAPVAVVIHPVAIGVISRRGPRDTGLFGAIATAVDLHTARALPTREGAFVDPTVTVVVAAVTHLIQGPPGDAH